MYDNEKISFSIDWLTSTFDFIQFDDVKAPYGSILRNKYEEGREKLNELYRLLTYDKFDERTEEKKRFKDYSQRVYLGEFIQFFLNGCKNSKGLKHSKIEISGNGCRDFINRGGNWFNLFNWMYTGINAVSNKPTRIDVAIDVKTKIYFTFDTLVDWLFNRGLYSSPLRDISHTSSKRKLKDLLYWRGNTLYIGSMTSNCYLCIYDKELERKQAGDESPMLDECWYRIEIRFREEQATWFIENFLKTQDRGDYSFIMDALYQVLDIKTDDQNFKTLRHRETAKWWQDFLHDASKAKFNDRKINPITLEKKQKYVEVNAGMSITQLMYCFDSPEQSIDYILNIVETKTEDMENKELIQVNEFREEKGLKPFKNIEEFLDYKDRLLMLRARFLKNG